MGNTRDTGYLQNLVTYDASGNIVLPANLTVNGNLLVATQSYVNTQISGLINGAPALLDTLDELAAALGDDANFASNITSSIAGKQAQLNGTGFVKVSGTTVSYDNSTYVTTDTSQSITGAKVFTSWNLALEANNTAQETILRNSPGTQAVSIGKNIFGFNGSNNIYFNKGAQLNAGIFAFNNTEQRTYTLPDASGTFALTSDLSSYITLGTTQSITGVKTFDTGSLILAAAGTANSTHLRNSSGDGTSVSGSNVFGFNSSNNIYFRTVSKGGFIFSFNNGAANRTYTLQDASGTLAFTADIFNALTGYVTLNTAQTINGFKTFSNTIFAPNGLTIDEQVLITKSSNSGGLVVNQTGGAGNAVTITGGLLSAEAATLTGALNGTSATFSQDSTFHGVTIGRGGGGSSQSFAYNTAIGSGALAANTTGIFNTAIGFNALANHTTGNSQVAIGLNAGRYINSGANNVTSSNSVYIGLDTRASANGNTNEIVIGSETRGNGSNTVTLGNDAITNTYLKGALTAGGATFGGDTIIQGNDSSRIVLWKFYSGNPAHVGLTIQNRNGDYTFTHNSNGGGTNIFGTLTVTGTVTFSNGLGISRNIVAGEPTPLNLSYTSSDGLGPAIRLGSGQGFWDVQPSNNNQRLSFEWTDSVNALSLFSDGNVTIGSNVKYSERLAVTGGNGEILAGGRITYNASFTTYTPDGLFSGSAVPGRIITPGGNFRMLFGYLDEGGGQYWGRIGFQGNTNWSLGTDRGGNNFSIGINNVTNRFTLDSSGNTTLTGNLVINNTISSPGNLIETSGLNLYLRPAAGHTVFVDTGNGLSVSNLLDVVGNVRYRGSIYDQFNFVASGNYTNGTYYNIVQASQIGTGIYILDGEVDTYGAGGGTYFTRFASVPFYMWEVGSNSTTFVDLPPVLGTGHHLGNPFPLFRLQMTLGGAGIFLQFNPNATWAGIDNSGGKAFRVNLKRIG